MKKNFFKKICPNGEFTRENFIKYFSSQNPKQETEILCSQLFNGFDLDKSS